VGKRQARGYFEVEPSSAGNPYGSVQAFVGRDSAEVRQIPVWSRIEGELIEVNTVVDRSHEVGPPHWATLRVADGD